MFFLIKRSLLTIGLDVTEASIKIGVIFPYHSSLPSKSCGLAFFLAAHMSLTTPLCLSGVHSVNTANLTLLLACVAHVHLPQRCDKSQTFSCFIFMLRQSTYIPMLHINPSVLTKYVLFHASH